MFFKRWSPVVAFALCATLAACGGNNDDNNPTNVTPNNMTTNVNPNNVTTNVDPNNCAGVSTCDAAGSSCSGSSSVVCAADANGCLVETTTDCSATSQMCMGGACVDVQPCSDDAACAGVADGGRFCSGDVLTTCADNGAGCLVASTNDCAAGGQTCDMDTQACVAACTDDAACAGLANGDSFCDGAGYTTCADNGAGCLVATATACAAGETCDDTAGSASCTNSCPEALQALSCADAGQTIMINSANGTNVVTDNACNDFGDTFDANEVFLTFLETANYEVTVDFTYDNVNINEVDAFALAGTGVCTDVALTCEGLDYGFSGGGSLDFGAVADQPYYLLFEPYSAAGETTNYGITITCTAIVCGDGIIGAGEQCDDGNAGDGDGCDSNCAEEAGYVCTGEPSACVPDVCGDGQLSPNESCDDMNLTDGDGCDSTCEVEFGYECDANGTNCALYPSIGTFAADATIPDSTGGPVAGSECDFYSITFSDTSVVSGTVNRGTTGNIDIYIYDEVSLFHRGEAFGDEAFSSLVFGPGTYVVALCATSTVDTYTLSLTTTALTSTDIGTFAAAAAVTDTTASLGDGRTVFHTVTFSDNVQLSGTLTADTGNGNVSILFTNGSRFATFATAGDETFTDLALPAGTYLIGVTAAASAGDIGTYTLALSTTALTTTDIGTFAAGGTVMDQVGGLLTAGDSTYYSITFSADVSLTGSLAALSGDADLAMYASIGVGVLGFNDGDESFTDVAVAAGTYLIRVDAYAPAGDVSGYTLALDPN